MIYSYEIDKNCEYIPIHLNVVFNSKTLDFFKDILICEISERIYEKIKTIGKKFIVVDFDKIYSLDSRIFNIYVNLIESGYNFIFVNLSELCMSILNDDDLNGYVEKKGGIENCLFSKGLSFTNNQQYIEYCKTEKIDNFIKKLIADYLYENSDKKQQQLESTLVVANMYIDVKSIFVKPDIYVYVIYIICSLIKKSYDMKDIDYFISSSNNGAMLSLLVGQLLNKKVVNFVNLGPHLSLYNKDIINELVREKKYLLIYDFICMGTEVKLAKTILELKEAHLVGAVGISSYLRPNLKIKIDQIFHINDDEVKNFGYSVEVRSNLC